MKFGKPLHLDIYIPGRVGSSRCERWKGKSARVDLEMSHPKPHTSIDEHSLDFGGTAESFGSVEVPPGPKASKTMALHVAETLIEDIKSDSINVDIDNNTCHEQDIALFSDNTDVSKKTEEQPLDEARASNLDVDKNSQIPVPDTEELNDWSHIPRSDFPPENDKFLQEVAKAGA
ncbi:hypothetical protein BDDG_08213 [Blastomyces dermatitidis ATCC 18188]|uniref:Uncharacterized protein n=1 Tax=Ajellomyces dermatitidis (strain ATCC 18188 / CBS 674.68) TaxID=653446 RepID=F2TPY7_AJEDA|nr:hypothetical protein BDDG_08213 [Blastomyces dermatitidis ATCC 18188]